MFVLVYILYLISLFNHHNVKRYLFIFLISFNMIILFHLSEQHFIKDPPPPPPRDYKKTPSGAKSRRTHGLFWPKPFFLIEYISNFFHMNENFLLIYQVLDKLICYNLKFDYTSLLNWVKFSPFYRKRFLSPFSH